MFDSGLPIVLERPKRPRLRGAKPESGIVVAWEPCENDFILAKGSAWVDGTAVPLAFLYVLILKGLYAQVAETIEIEECHPLSLVQVCASYSRKWSWSIFVCTYFVKCA